MIQTLNPYSSKTDEIMSRYRPIAPKPEIPALTNSSNNNGSTSTTTSTTSYDVGGPLIPEKFRQSPYLRNIWSHLQARPTRTRKRGRTAGIPTTMLKKQQQYNHNHNQKMVGPGPTFFGMCSPSAARNLSFQAFAVYGDHLHHPRDVNSENELVGRGRVTLPLLSTVVEGGGGGGGGERKKGVIDLNAVEGLEERDLLLQLQVPSGGCSNGSPLSSSSSSSSSANNNLVISPRPVRPVGSSISVVGPISEDPEAQVVAKKPEEVEAAVEAEALPAVITDRSNKVRMANSAYKELVGQPECPWLDSMVISSSAGKRISGEVMLRLSGPDTGLPVSGNGFSCWVRIEWESDGNKNSLNAFCDAVRLACESKDYLFSWRFHTREVSPSGSKV